MKIIFAGTPGFAEVILQALLNSSHQVIAVYTQPDRPAGRGRKLTPSPVKQLASTAGIPIFQPVSLRDGAAQEQLQQLQADVMVVAAYGLILPQPVLTAPRFGCLNVHASLLPRWRGAAPIQRAILAGDNQTGVTIMQMDRGLDTGAMLLQTPWPISSTTTSESLHNELAKIGVDALLDVLAALAANRLCPVPQDNALATYAGKINKAEALVDWEMNAKEIDQRVRAFNPWPVAFAQIGDMTVRLWRTECLEQESQQIPGTVMQADKDGIVIATSQGWLKILELQLAGGRRMSVTDFLNANNYFLSLVTKNR